MTLPTAKSLREQWWDEVAEATKFDNLTDARKRELLASQQRVAQLNQLVEGRQSIRAAINQPAADKKKTTPKNKALPKKVVQSMHRMFRQGYTLTEIARKFGVYASTVGKHVKGYKPALVLKGYSNSVGMLPGMQRFRTVKG